ncbi:hypothetical protein HK096_001767, partial [Nowakowskiella sp. JEL0078]
MNSSVNASTGYSPFFLAFGFEPSLLPTGQLTLSQNSPTVDLVTGIANFLEQAYENLTLAQECQAL